MISKKITLPAGAFFHARPCAVIASAVKGLDCMALLFAGTKMADAASPISLMKLGFPPAGEVEIMTDGADEAAAMEAILNAMERAF